jgi:uncharacterized protein YqhQ
MDETVRLGGMALGNGVLVHGPTAWACAVREPDGTLKVAAARKGFRATGVSSPLLRGPARLLESLLVLPVVRRELPEARFPFERRGVLAAMAATAVATRFVRTSRLGPFAKELAAGLLTLAPALQMLRGGELSAYHGAEHVAIGSYEHGGRATKEHERCGSHLVGPIILTTAVGNALAAKAPARWRTPARAVASVASLGAATELFGWMVRHPEHPVSRALALPGHELQHRLSTTEPSPEQLEVAELALATCLELEHGHANAR